MGLGFGVGWGPLLGTSKFRSEGKMIGVNKHQTANPDRMNDADGWVRTKESSQPISGTLNEDGRALMEEIEKETTAQRKPQLD